MQGAQGALAHLSKLLFSGAFLSGVTALASMSLYVVPAGHRAVIFDRFQGVKKEVKGEGMHFRIPWVQVSSQVSVSQVTQPRLQLSTRLAPDTLLSSRRLAVEVGPSICIETD